MTAPAHSLAQLLDASATWWATAGVDLAFREDVTVWLQGPTAQAAVSAPVHEGQAAAVRAPAARPAAVQADLAHEAQPPADPFGDDRPQTLAQFREFWLSAAALHPAPLQARVAPRGAADPALMVLVLEPEASDTDTLLSGPQGALLAQILRAMGIAQDRVYVASALPAPTPLADPAALARTGLGAVLLHHIDLVRPPAILAFGAGLAPLLEAQDGQNGMSLRENKHRPLVPPMLQSEALASLIAMPRLKARFWRRWLEWSAQN